VRKLYPLGEQAQLAPLSSEGSVVTLQKAAGGR
jgi:hypothetical protein